MEKKLQIKKLLCIRSYLLFWLSTSFSMSASNIIQFVLSLYVLEETGSATIFGSMLSIVIIPRLFFTPIAGVLSDRIRRIKVMRIVMLLASLFLSLFFVIIFVCTHKINILFIYLIVIFLELIEVFYQSAEFAILPEIIDTELLTEAVSLAKIDDGIVYVATPAIGTLVYKLFSIHGALLLTAILFFMSYFCNLFISTPYYKGASKTNKKTNDYFTDFKDGITIIKNNKFLKQFILIVPVFNFFFSSVYAVTMAHVLLVSFDVGEAAYSIYRSISASMVIFVPLFAMPIVKKIKMKNLVIYSSLIVTVVLFCNGILIASVYFIGLHIKYYVLIFITILDCIVISVMMPVHMSISIFYQTAISDEYRSRVLSVIKMFSMIAITLGNMTFGFLTDLFAGYINFFIAMFGTLICFIFYRKAFDENVKSFAYDNPSD